MPVVGFDSLRYFWTKRTPESFARDLGRIMRTYAQRWRRSHVVVIGYSHGADVVPFAVNRLDAATRTMVSSVVLIGLGERASFEFHVGNWIGLGKHNEPPTAPEMQRLQFTSVICIHGADDTESKCDSYANTTVRVIQLPGGHHFNGDYAGLARTIVREVKAAAAARPPPRRAAR
jgi:type IV secretory pathway VirJ component